MRLLVTSQAPVGIALLATLAMCCPAEPAKPTTPPVVATVAVVPPVAPPAGPPIARTVDTIDHEFGLAVPDPYRWMEGQDNSELTTWLVAQGEYAANQLAKAPGRDELHKRVRELGLGVANVGGVQIANGRTIYSTQPADAQLAKLATRDGGIERILIDPEKLGSGTTHASLNAYSISPDGKYVGFVIAMGGAEAGEIHVMDLATGAQLPDSVDQIWGEFAPAWTPDSKAFFYTQMTPSADPMQNMVARYHVLGQPVAKDVAVLAHDANTFPLEPQEFPFVWIDPASPDTVIAAGGGARSELHLAIAKRSQLDVTGKAQTPWRVVANYSDAIEDVVPHAGRLYLSTYKGAPNRKLISVPVDAPDLAKARLEIAEDPGANLANVGFARDGIYAVYDAGGLAKLARWPWSGKPTPIALPGDGWIPNLVTSMLLDGATYNFNTWTKPAVFYTYDAKAKTSTPNGLATTSKFNDERIVATEVEVPNGDVTVPLSILHFKDSALDGSHPTYVSAYAAYGSSQHPYFSATRIAWLERGGVLAICHARGGAERGRSWQDDGSRDKKLNGVRDLVACGEYLVAQHYTTSARLGVEGGSAGGIIVGRAMDERPDLFAAVHIAVGMVNPLRILASPNGANQIGELGDPRNEPDYKWLLAMDPYLDAKPAGYPAVLFTLGLNDRRVVPWMSAKMAARLLAVTTSGKPVWVRVETDAGHGIGSTRDQAFAEYADVWAFMLQQFAAH